jgi:hypothetical protein
MDFGDSHVDLTPSNVFAYLAAQNQSPSLTEFYFKYRDTGTAQLLSRVLWESSIQPVSKPLPPETPSALFADRGIAVLRDGWGTGANVVAMRAGMNFNHNHADQGSLFYANKGKLWLGEAGYADYYKDPSYPLFNIQALGHNVLLVDGNPESQSLPGNAEIGLAPSFTHALVGEGASLLQTDLSTVYGGSVSSYTRSLFSAPGGALVVVDHVIADNPHTFQQIWHPKAHVTSLDCTANRWRMTDRDTHVDVQSFGTQPLSVSEKLDPMPLEAYERSEHGPIDRPIRLEVSTRLATKEVTMVTVIESETGVSENASGVAWSNDGTFLILKTGGTTLRIRNAGGADGPAISSSSQDAVIVLVGNRLEDLRSDGLILTNHDVDIALRHKPSGNVELEIHADTATKVTLQGLETAGKSPLGPEHASSFEVMAGRTLVSLRPRPKP